MTSATAILIGVVWMSLVGLVALELVRRSPKRRKPVDELEAVDAALRNRLVDLEDKFESYVKREAVRGMRARKDEREEQAAQGVLPLDRATRLLAVRQRARAAGLIRGG